MIKFCIHERHVGVCAKTGGYCVDGFCPDEEIRDFVIAILPREYVLSHPSLSFSSFAKNQQQFKDNFILFE